MMFGKMFFKVMFNVYMYIHNFYLWNFYKLGRLAKELLGVYFCILSYIFIYPYSYI